jgi:hypothetical protein
MRVFGCCNQVVVETDEGEDTGKVSVKRAA